MFVVKRPFKNLGKTYEAGSVIQEPATIKRFNGKLAEGKIIEVTEQTYDSAFAYFKTKYGVELPSMAKPVEAKDTTKTDVEKVTKPVKATTTAKAKAVTK